MGIPLGVNTNVRDINLSFKDSCNCCWGFDKHPKAKDDIFINKDGTFEKYSPKKSKDQVSSNQANILRLEERLDQLSKESSVCPQQLKYRVRQKSGISFDEPGSQKLSYGKLREINNVFLDVLKEKREREGSSCL